MSLHVTLDVLRAARDDLAPHLGHSALHPSTQDYLRKLVDIDGYLSLLWLICVMLGIHMWARRAGQVFIRGNGQVTCTTGKTTWKMKIYKKNQTNNKKSQNKTFMSLRHSSRHRRKEEKALTQKWRKGTTDVARPGAIQVITV